MSTILTVSQINTYLKSIVDGDDNLKNIYVSGEISNFTNHYRTGHFYFTLKDETAAVKAVMFRSAAQRIRFLPENGLRVIVRCSVSIFERDGVYQLYCEDMQPDGVGALHLAFEQLKDKLARMGLFDEDAKRALPTFPKRIGVITSPTGAALHDILTVLERRFPAATVVFEGVQVQGDAAAPQIAAAIARFNALKGADVLIVGRGGGSMEDLWAFNEEIVAHAIYDSVIPVISAVGHETDFTIADFVADCRAPTPSAAAELAVPDQREVLFQLDGLLDRLTFLMEDVCAVRAQTLQSLSQRLAAVSPQQTIAAASEQLTYQSERLTFAMQTVFQRYAHTLEAAAARLESNSPLRILSRGYASVTKKDQTPLRSVHDAHPGDPVTVRLADGRLRCTVDEVLYEKGS